MYIGNNIQHSQMSTLKRPTLWGPWPQKSAAHPQAATNATPPARLVSCATFLVQVRPNCVVCVCVCVWPGYGGHVHIVLCTYVYTSVLLSKAWLCTVGECCINPSRNTRRVDWIRICWNCFYSPLTRWPWPRSGQALLQTKVTRSGAGVFKPLLLPSKSRLCHLLLLLGPLGIFKDST